MFVWQVCTGGSWKGSGAQWSDYAEPLNTEFETAKNAGQHTRIRYTLRTQTYEIDLVAMTQTNLGFNTARAMRRSWVEAADMMSSQTALAAQFPDDFGEAVAEENTMEEVHAETPVLSIDNGASSQQ